MNPSLRFMQFAFAKSKARRRLAGFEKRARCDVVSPLLSLGINVFAFNSAQHRMLRPCNKLCCEERRNALPFNEGPPQRSHTMGDTVVSGCCSGVRAFRLSLGIADIGPRDSDPIRLELDIIMFAGPLHSKLSTDQLLVGDLVHRRVRTKFAHWAAIRLLIDLACSELKCCKY